MADDCRSPKCESINSTSRQVGLADRVVFNTLPAFTFTTLACGLLFLLLSEKDFTQVFTEGFRGLTIQPRVHLIHSKKRVACAVTGDIDPYPEKG